MSSLVLKTGEVWGRRENTEMVSNWVCANKILAAVAIWSPQLPLKGVRLWRVHGSCQSSSPIQRVPKWEHQRCRRHQWVGRWSESRGRRPESRQSTGPDAGCSLVSFPHSLQQTWGLPRGFGSYTANVASAALGNWLHLCVCFLTGKQDCSIFRATKAIIKGKEWKRLMETLLLPKWFCFWAVTRKKFSDAIKGEPYKHTPFLFCFVFSFKHLQMNALEI